MDAERVVFYKMLYIGKEVIIFIYKRTMLIPELCLGSSPNIQDVLPGKEESTAAPNTGLSELLWICASLLTKTNRKK